MGKRLLLRSDLNIDDGQYDIVLYWDACKQADDKYSIPQIIEARSDQFKAQYLDWLHQFGKTKVGDKRVIDHLLVRQDFSLWWMSLLFEKSKWKSPGLYQVFQLMALEEILKSIDDIERIDVAVESALAYQSISTWCESRGIYCYYTGISKQRSVAMSLTQLFTRLPYMLQAIIWFMRHITLRKASNSTLPSYKRASKSKKNVCFISYFFNLNIEQIQQGVFSTRYWTGLHDVLIAHNAKVHWLHLFEKSRDCNEIKQAVSLVVDLNRGDQSELHALVEQHISIDVIWRTFKDYFKSVISGLKINRQARESFKITESGINFYPVLSSDWRCSLFGKTAISGCLYLNIFEKIFGELPIQNQGFYLMENQPWERSMVYAWKKGGHGRIVGVPHTVVSYWDLRHFYSTREHLENPVYEADLVAVNGAFSEQMYLASGFPKEKLQRVEALRYLYLSDVKKPNTNVSTDKTRLLLLGDCDADIVNKQMKLVIDCLELANHRIELLVKPHPLSPITPSDFPQTSFTVVTQPLNELVEQYEVALASNPTAAAVDAYLSGKKTLIMLDYTSFNMNPLRGCGDVHFVSEAAEVWSILRDLDPNDQQAELVDFFDLDVQLPQWRKVLDL